MKKQDISLWTCIFLCIVLVLSLSSCSPSPAVKSLAEIEIDYGEANHIDFNQINPPKYLSIKEFPLKIDSDYEVGGIAEANSDIFYLCAKPSQLEYFDDCKLIRVDENSGAEVDEYSFDTSDNLYVNELVGTKEDLFWVETHKGRYWQIKRYNLKSKQTQTIRASDDMQQDILLNGSANWVSWLEYSPTGYGLLYVYDIQNDETILLCSEIESYIPYIRVTVLDSIISYVTKDGENYIINIYNLKTSSFLAKITVGTEYPGNVHANKDFTIWCSEPFWGDIDIFAYDLKNHETLKVLSSEDSASVFSYTLLNDFLLINSRSEDNIIYFNMRDKEKSNITKNLKESHMYYFAHANEDNSFIACEDYSVKGNAMTVIVHINSSL